MGGWNQAENFDQPTQATSELPRNVASVSGSSIRAALCRRCGLLSSEMRPPQFFGSSACTIAIPRPRPEILVTVGLAETSEWKIQLQGLGISQGIAHRLRTEIPWLDGGLFYSRLNRRRARIVGDEDLDFVAVHG